jgi:hypothetical protein
MQVISGKILTEEGRIYLDDPSIKIIFKFNRLFEKLCTLTNLIDGC